MGIGILHGKASKQKINVNSSTENEIVGLFEYLPYTLWMGDFLKAQGYKIKKSTVFQDNTSALKMDKNGRNSCSGNSRHMNVRYFFVKDRFDKEIELRYCPTQLMLAVFFTKPLQGALFLKLRELIMNWKDISTLEYTAKNKID